MQFSLRPKGPWVADNLDQRIARLPAIAYGFVVRWTVPEMRSMAQFLLVLSGVLLGTAATLLIEFLLPAVRQRRQRRRRMRREKFKRRR